MGLHRAMVNFAHQIIMKSFSHITDPPKDFQATFLPMQRSPKKTLSRGNLPLARQNNIVISSLYIYTPRTAPRCIHTTPIVQWQRGAVPGVYI